MGGVKWSAVGSLNGGEISHKINREVVMLTDTPEVHARLVEVFAWDWAQSRLEAVVRARALGIL